MSTKDQQVLESTVGVIDKFPAKMTADDMRII